MASARVRGSDGRARRPIFRLAPYVRHVALSLEILLGMNMQKVTGRRIPDSPDVGFLLFLSLSHPLMIFF